MNKYMTDLTKQDWYIFEGCELFLSPDELDRLAAISSMLYKDMDEQNYVLAGVINDGPPLTIPDVLVKTFDVTFRVYVWPNDPDLADELFDVPVQLDGLISNWTFEFYMDIRTDAINIDRLLQYFDGMTHIKMTVNEWGQDIS